MEYSGRLTVADRRAIERGLRAGRGCREIAASIGRSPSTVSEEVRRNRTLCDRGMRGMPAKGLSKNDCPRMAAWPWTCNSCFTFPRACGRHPRCEYSSIFAQGLAEERASSSRRGINAREEDFEAIAAIVRDEVSRGISPQQICQGHPELGLAPSTLYRWIERNYFGMSNMDLRRKVGYRPRRSREATRVAAHGPERSYAAFCELPQGARDAACEMDTVCGGARASKRLLTLYMRPCRVQLALLIPEATVEAVAAAIDGLERTVGADVFSRLFSTILTDNGHEFSDAGAIESSALSDGSRCKVYYCDVRQSQQKGRCERNHAELRKMLPKGRGIDFDGLDGRDCAVLMSHLNSEPRPSLMGMTPLGLLRTADPDAYSAITCALGIEEIPFDDLCMTHAPINAERARRGLPPIL